MMPVCLAAPLFSEQPPPVLLGVATVPIAASVGSSCGTGTTV